MRRAPALDATRGPGGAPYPPYDATTPKATRRNPPVLVLRVKTSRKSRKYAILRIDKADALMKGYRRADRLYQDVRPEALHLPGRSSGKVSH